LAPKTLTASGDTAKRATSSRTPDQSSRVTAWMVRGRFVRAAFGQLRASRAASGLAWGGVVNEGLAPRWSAYCAQAWRRVQRRREPGVGPIAKTCW
jgi:hypothetical protein